ncbi:MAG: inorganic diphosphatase [Bacteroidota bacterium]
MDVKDFILGLFFLVLYAGCQTPVEVDNFMDPQLVQALNEDGTINAVIEIPAGTNLKIEYDYQRKGFFPDRRNGKDRVIEYLPYPGNYGFIPSTKADTASGGDGDALDILVICSSLPTGTVIPVQPIAMLALFDQGEKDDKIIAVPADSLRRTLQVSDYKTLTDRYPKALVSIQHWFESYNPMDSVTNIQWHSERIAEKEVRKWLIANDKQ